MSLYVGFRAHEAEHLSLSRSSVHWGNLAVAPPFNIDLDDVGNQLADPRSVNWF